MTADEAHKPTVQDVREWLCAFKADALLARAMIPLMFYRLLHDLQYLENDVLTEKGEAECAA